MNDVVPVIFILNFYCKFCSKEKRKLANIIAYMCQNFLEFFRVIPLPLCKALILRVFQFRIFAYHF